MTAKKKQVSEELIDLMLDEATQPVSMVDIQLNTVARPPPQASRETPANANVAYGSSRPSEEKKGHGPSGSSAQSSEIALKQSEHLRIAQRKISDLEDELQRVHKENEKLGSAGETYKRLKEELASKLENTQRDKENEKNIHSEEVKLLKDRVHSKEREVIELQRQQEEMELRLETNLRKIRKREKDLEHRLEIAKIEEMALLKSKDEMILNLKRRMDQMELETENFNKRTQALYKKLEGKQDNIRRVIKALRIALSQLEGEEDGEKN